MKGPIAIVDQPDDIFQCSLARRLCTIGADPNTSNAGGTDGSVPVAGKHGRWNYRRLTL
ncbi:MAG: hypothetical protein IPM82_28715 [Saprospiraceae bacterium]|nr:hypothetical protein [Saprospiraceae bacterium]